MRIRDTSHRQQQMRAFDFGCAYLATHLRCNPVRALADIEACRVEPEGNTLGFENSLYRRGHVLVFARDHSRAHLDHRDAAAEATVHLREFEADVAAADNDQMFRQEVDVHHARVGQVRHITEAGHVGDRRAAADVDKHLSGFEQIVVTLTACGTRSALAANQSHIGCTFEPAGHALIRLLHDGVLARLDASHVDANRTVDHHAEIRAAACDVRGPRTRDQRLGGNATVVDASAADKLALDYATLRPALPSRTASGGPACPVPMTIASKVCFMRMLLRGAPWRAKGGTPFPTSPRRSR